MKPVLIYKSEDICFNILNYMAEQLGNALSSLGIDVIYFDAFSEGAEKIVNYVGNEYLAVIGFQSAAFKVRFRKDNTFLHDSIYGPKFNVFFDHPIFLHDDCLDSVPSDYYVLTHDSNYLNFIKRYFPGISNAFLFPPGGSIADVEGTSEKEDDISFIGTYLDYRTLLPRVREVMRKCRLAGEFLECLRGDSTLAQENALRNVLERNNKEVSDDEFVVLFDKFKLIPYMLNIYNREKVVGKLLDSGVSVVAYDERWNKAPFADNAFLKVRSAVTPEESLRAYSRSKLSLNVMSGHKAGFTERISNSMLNRSVVVSDYSSCLAEQYENNKELLLFRLEELDEVPERIKAVLANESLREEIADRAFLRAYSEDTWLERAKLLVEYLYEIMGN